MKKKLGVLCHVSSLPSEYGIGDFGKCCKDFLDFLSKNNFSIWQILPLTDTNDKNSPYGSLSYFTFEEFFIDPLDLVNKGLLTMDDLSTLKSYAIGNKVNYAPIRSEKKRLLNIAYNNITDELKDLVLKYLIDHPLLKKYAYYKTLLEVFNTDDWRNVDRKYFIDASEYENFYQEHFETILRYTFIQYLLENEWNEVLAYAKKKNIEILGDLPIYPEVKSFDVFNNPSLFLLDDNYNPLVYGGAPADGFSSQVQNWHTCVYNWDYLKENHYSFLIDKINILLSHYNILRLDHFNGYIEHFEIDANDESKTKWETKGGMEFFTSLKNRSHINKIIVEDLGIFKPEGQKIKKTFNLRGMAVLEFILDGEDNYKLSPLEVDKKQVYYLGTHDNLPFLGFLNSLTEDRKNKFKELLNLTALTNKGLQIETMRQLIESDSEIVIFQIQDLLMEDEKYRMNDPSKSDNCWEYKLVSDYQNKIGIFLKDFLDI